MHNSDTDPPLPASGFEVIELPNPLAAKAGAFRARNVDHDRLDASLARLVRNYPEAIADQRVALRDCWNRIRTGADSEEDHRRFGAIVHDFKGQAASFGYPLVGRIAETLSLLAKFGALGNARVRPVIEAHVCAIEQILKAHIQGDGGSDGTAILESLRLATAQGAP